jgi:hypothetical protein
MYCLIFGAVVTRSLKRWGLNLFGVALTFLLERPSALTATSHPILGRFYAFSGVAFSKRLVHTKQG